MANFLPFLAVLPNSDLADQIVTLPFDGYSSKQKEHILASNPVSFLQVILDHNQEQDARRKRFLSFFEQGFLQKTDAPVFLVYRQHKNNACYTGFIGLIPIGTDADYLAIKKHEATLVHKEALLAEYLDNANLNAEPALLTFNATPQSQELLQILTKPKPDFDISLPDFGQHQLWLVNNPKHQAQIKAVFADLPSLYIADGHHRISSSRRLALQRFQQHNRTSAADQYFLAACFPSNEAQILPYHRFVKKVPSNFLNQLQLQFGSAATIQPALFSNPNSNHWMLRIHHQWFQISFNPPLPHSTLAADWLNDHVLAPLLNMHDLSSDKNIGFVGGQLNEFDLIQAQLTAAADALFVLPPVQFHQFFSMVNQGQLMPPKSTWFEPKLLSGFTMFDLADSITP
jgi:uncharacterized protein (DUF1015 family)